LAVNEKSAILGSPVAIEIVVRYKNVGTITELALNR
jgi:hypothetical protein